MGLQFVPDDPSKPVVLTGPIQGTVTLPDGTVYDVSDPFIAVDSPEHATQVAHAIGLRYAAEGHPDHTPDDEGNVQPFVYTPTEG